MSIESVVPSNHLILCCPFSFRFQSFLDLQNLEPSSLPSQSVDISRARSQAGLCDLSVHWGNLVPLALSSLNLSTTQGFSLTVPLLFTRLLLGRRGSYVFLHLLCSCGASHHPYISYLISRLFKLLPLKMLSPFPKEGAIES